MNMMTGFTTRPLKVASYIGFAFALMGIFLMIYLLLLWMFQGSVVPGFTFLASIVILFSGAQLLALGIMGEYLARIHVGAMGRPPFLVREIL
jgi:undecaprenyl-phosphate 4-deoxy-4-formamido-L-arabinose transferase